MKKTPPSMEDWLREAKNSPDALKIGMFLIHNGVVRQSPKAKVRQGIDDGSSVKGMEFTYNQEKVNVAIKETLKMDGIFYTKVWLNEGQLELGDDIMYILIGGDIRPNVINGLEFLVEKIKKECVTEIEIMK
ncbi:MAG TPA: molybdopterin biosynthesis protein [Eubacteriaceae bacterium]|nr:molybdopterin biosynthesis protein [Eubacteriaceae bacterium]